MKKLVLVCLFIAGATLSFAQQITMFGVVDTSLVYSTFYRNSSAVRNYDAKRAQFQKEIDNLTNELREKQTRMLELERDGKKTEALRLQTQITKDTEYLQEYSYAKNIELDNLQKNLANSNEFYQNLYEVIEDIAEAEGFSMILDMQNDAILWYSPSVDITRDVIEKLSAM